ncbi:MAG: DUF2490 domain-containing protein [Salibacteraceae bacterium]
MKNFKFLISLLSVFYALSASSQDGEYVTIRDLETWNSVGINYKISKKWRIGLEEQFRFSNNSSELDGYFTELSTKYKFNKFFYGGIGFRYIKQNDNVGKVQGFENHIRFHFDLGVKHKISRFNLEYRLRFQTKNELGISKEEGDYANNRLRLKASVGYNIKKWKLDPEFSTEIFSHFQKDEQNGFDNFRFTVGTSYKTKSFGKLGLYYRMERELNAIYPKTTNIIRVKYVYTLKNKKK